MWRLFIKGLMRLALTVLVVGVSLASATGYANRTLLVETAELEQLLNDAKVRIVDVRAKQDYEKGHIPNAVHFGFQDVVNTSSRIQSALLPPEKLAQMLGERGIGKDTTVVLYDDTGGFRASRLFWMLEYYGHQNVAMVNGGFPKWVREGRAVTKAIPQIAKAAFPVDFMERRIATADWLLDRQDDPNVVVIDVRGPGSYAKGHIPWAKNIPWKGNLTADQTLKPADELHEHFASKGVTKDKNIAIHCQDGRAAAHSYFTLRLLGYQRVRSYDRSWAEWGRADDLPRVVDASNPCASQANPCNPCSAKNPCNPCAARK